MKTHSDRTKTMTGPAKHQALVAAARRVLWDFLREQARPLRQARSALRQRLSAFLRRSAAGKLAAILRSGALAAALAAPGGARGQEVAFPAIELADVDAGRGGFVVRGSTFEDTQLDLWPAAKTRRRTISVA